MPLFRDLRHYRPEWLSRDVIAGLSVAAVQVPTAVAYAQLAGFSPEIGLYSSMLPVFAYALFGSSRQLIVGPDAATCAMVAALLVPLAAGDQELYLKYSAALAIMTGLLMIIGGAARLGFIVNFFAQPVLLGYLNGIALSIIAGQLGRLSGIHLENRDFMPSLHELAVRLEQTHWLTLAVGVSTLVLLVALKRFVPRAPQALIALTLAALGVFTLGAAASGVDLVGAVPTGLPSLHLPGVGYAAGQAIGMEAVGLVIVSFTSGMLTARSFAARNGYAIDPNQELRAFGIANLASGLSSGFAVTGADSRTAVNDAAGGKTQLVSVVAALATGAVAVFFAAQLGYLPQAALAAVLIFSAFGLLDLRASWQLRTIDRFEFRLSVLTTVGVLTIGVLPGVVLAILLALFHVLAKIYKPQDTILGRVPGLDGYNDIELDPRSEMVPGAILYRFEGPLLFFNAEYFKSRVRTLCSETTPRPHWFVLSVESVTQVDTSGIQALDVIHSELKAEGIQLLVARPKLYMRRYGETTGIALRVGRENVFPSVRAAVEAMLTREARTDGIPAVEVPDRSFRAFFDNQRRSEQSADPGDNG